jgi:hypothetical protein
MLHPVWRTAFCRIKPFSLKEKRMFVEEKANGEVKKLDEISHLLLKAAALIERDGWGDGDCKKRGYCAFAAMVVADGPHATSTPLARQAGLRFAKALGFNSTTPIFRWNDAPGRTKEEVIAKLRAVAFSS